MRGISKSSGRVELFAVLLSFMLSYPIITSGQSVSFTNVKDELVELMFLKSGDLDLDSEIDLVYSGWIFNSYVAWGQGSGLFQTPALISPPSGSSIALDYVNSDTLLDIIGVSSANIYILENNGNRTFSTSSWSHSSASLTFVTTGYFNNDAYLDFVTSPAIVYFGDGTGAFPSSANLPVDTAYGADMSDFNKDGYDDLVVTTTDSAFILLNDGSGSFSVSAGLGLGEISISVSSGNALADFNNDGNPDFALMVPLTGASSCTPRFFVTQGLVGFGDGSGGLLDTSLFEVCGTSYNLVTADVNQDFELDIVIANGSFGRLEVLLGNGDGTFQPPAMVSLNTIQITFALTSADLDQDGNPDFVSGPALSSEPDSIISALNDLPGQQILNDEMVTTGFTSVDFEIMNPNGYEISRFKSTVAGSRYDRFDKDSDGTLDVQTSDYNLQYGTYTLVFRRQPDITAPATFSSAIRIDGTQHLRIFQAYETPGTSKSSAPNDSIVFRIDIEQFPSIVPISGATEFDDMPNFRWNGLFTGKNISVNTYEFQLDSKIDFSAPIFNETGLTNRNFTLNAPLTRDAIYYWRLRTFDGANYSPWSNEFAVYIGPFFCGDVNNDGTGANILDLTYLVDRIFRGGAPAPIPVNADLNGDGDSGNILDLTALVDYKFRQMTKPMCGI